MINRKYLLGLFSIFSITIIFTDENKVLWDFGVEIKPSVQNIAPNKRAKYFSNSELDHYTQMNAIIADPFISPTLSSRDEKVSDPSFIIDDWNEILLNNIHQVKLLAGRFTMQINYQPVIDLISQIDLRQLDKKDSLDLNYWLANALLHTGKYIEAEDVILANMAVVIDDRFHFLLAMNYEFQGRLKVAYEEYLEFINQFPKSEYTVVAQIKARMLERH